MTSPPCYLTNVEPVYGTFPGAGSYWTFFYWLIYWLSFSKKRVPLRKQNFSLKYLLDLCVWKRFGGLTALGPSEEEQEGEADPTLSRILAVTISRCLLLLRLSQCVTAAPCRLVQVFRSSSRSLVAPWRAHLLPTFGSGSSGTFWVLSLPAASVVVFSGWGGRRVFLWRRRAQLFVSFLLLDKLLQLVAHTHEPAKETGAVRQRGVRGSKSSQYLRIQTCGWDISSSSVVPHPPWSPAGSKVDQMNVLTSFLPDFTDMVALANHVRSSAGSVKL